MQIVRKPSEEAQRAVEDAKRKLEAAKFQLANAENNVKLSSDVAITLSAEEALVLRRLIGSIGIETITYVLAGTVAESQGLREIGRTRVRKLTNNLYEMLRQVGID